MNSHYKTLLTAVVVTLTLSLCTSTFAQGPAELSSATPEAAVTAPAPEPDAEPNPVPQYPIGSDPGGDWRVGIMIYGWFPGIHGTVGVLGHDAGIHVPFSDVWHTLKGIIPIAVEADKGRLLVPVDFFWVKLGDGKGTPFTDVTQNYVNIHLTQSILTPKIGYRMYDGEHLKVDALGGIRYWHVGMNNTLEPSGLSNSRSANWVDGLGGARFILPLGAKAAITVGGDAGAGGANLDYQAVGLLSYNLTPKWGAAVGWRYLYVDYRPANHQFIFNTTMTGLVAGFSYTFGGKPPVPPTASCAASPTEVLSGDPVNATISTQNLNPKHTISYKWDSTGGKVSGTGTAATIDTTGLEPGSYSVTGTATDEKEKKNNVASCSAGFTVKARPNYPPTASCSASPTTIAIGEPSTITITASSPENRPLTYKWTSTGGQLTGGGTSVTLTATSADAGNTIAVTGSATDDHNLSGSCTAQVNVPPVQKCVNIEDWGECTFEKNPKKPWRVDNDCKDTLDKLSLRLQQMPDGKLNIVGYTGEQESVSEQSLAAQRAVNVKYYLTTDGPTKIDGSRIQPRQDGVKGKATHFYFVPEGTLCGGQLEEGTVVDETKIQPQPRNAPAPRKKAKKAVAVPPTN